MKQIIIFLMIKFLMITEYPFYRIGKRYGKIKKSENPIAEMIVYNVFRLNFKIMDIFNKAIKRLRYMGNF